MASSKVMTTTSTTNTDLPCQQPPLCPSLSSLLADFQNQHENPSENETDPSHTAAMDDILKNIYSTPTPDQVALAGAASLSREGSFSIAKEMGNKSVEEVWKEIVAGSGGGDQRGADEEMTLEDFLTRAGAVREEDVKAYTNNNNFNNVSNNHNKNNDNTNNNNGGGNKMEMVGGGGGRGKRRVVEEPPLDKATQQKQRRMIKNRESAARSRERKQAYTVELEFQVTKLEEENAGLLREEAEKNKARFKQLVENLIPVVEKRRPPRPLRRVHSLQW